MKKLFTVIIILICIFNSCATNRTLNYPEPEFDKPFVYVIDTFKAVGNFEDYVKLHNNSGDSNIRFNIYVNNPRNHEWIIYGVGILKRVNDTDSINPGIKDIKKYRYFAIESLNNKNYKYQFYKSHNDLHIVVLDE